MDQYTSADLSNWEFAAANALGSILCQMSGMASMQMIAESARAQASTCEQGGISGAHPMAKMSTAICTREHSAANFL